MKQFIVTITETLKLDVDVLADDEDEAEQIVTDDYNDSRYVLCADNFDGVEFFVTAVE